MKKNTILITGVAGFIGSHIADLFIKKGHTVIGIDNLKHGNKKNANKKVILYNVDLTKSRKVKKILSLHHPEIIIHHASNLVDVAMSHKHPWLTYKDVIMTSNMLEDAQLFGVKHIIFSSSANVYGNIEAIPITEDSPIAPLSPYGISKIALENHLQYYAKRYGTKVTIFRYFNVYGTRQSPHSKAAIPSFINGIINSEVISVRGGTQTRDFIYVKDVALANYLAATRGIAGTFNIGTGKQIQIISVIEHISRILKKKPLIKHAERDVSDAPMSEASIYKAKKMLKWSPQTTLETGLRETARYYKLLQSKKHYRS